MNTEQMMGDGSAVEVARNKQGKRIYSAEEREALIRQQAESGLSKIDFCACHGLHATTFYGWGKKKQYRKKQKKRAKPQLVEVEAKASSAPIEIALPNGKRLGLYLNGDNHALIQLIRGVVGC